MSTISVPNTFSNGQTADASQVNSNFTTIYNDYNGSISNVNVASNAAIAASKLNLTTIAQNMAYSSAVINWAKGSDIASATTTDIGAATGNFVDVTGTTTITGLGTVQAGTFRVVRFTGALTFTHNATSLILPGSANITTANGDVCGMVSLGSGNWKCAWYERQSGAPITAFTAATAPTGTVLQVVNTQTGAVATGTTTIPTDDTIPQNTEGDEYMTLAITPNNTGNKLLISVVANAGFSSTGNITTALFQDSTANALAATSSNFGNPNSFISLTPLTHYMTAGTTSSTTFKVRIGADSAGTITFNGLSGARKLGGVLASSITIKEIKG